MPAEQQRKAPGPITLKVGTPLRVRTTTTISTKSHKAGDRLMATLEEPLVAGDRVIAPKGSEVQGVVAHSDPGGRVKGVARLSVRLTELETPSGPLRISTGSVGRSARTTRKRDAMKIGAGSGIGAAIGAIAGGGAGAAIGAAAGGGAGTGMVMAMRGEAAVLPSESVLTFRLAAPVLVE